MPTRDAKQQPVLQRRRRFDPRRRHRLLGLIFVLLALVVQNVSSWLTYQAVRRTLDDQVGEQLLSVASSAAAGIPPEWVRSVSESGTESRHWKPLEDRLERIADETQIGNIYLFDSDKRNLYDYADRFPVGFVNPLLELDFGPVTAALAGVPTATALYEEGGAYLKTGYAPVRADGDVVGVLAVTGGARSFRVLSDIRRTFLLAGGLGLASMLVLGFLYLSILRGLERAEATVAQSSALAAAGELAAMVAHEIRNPLAVIRTRSERVLSKIERGADPEEILKWFEVIPGEVDRLNRILSGYLAFARPSTETQGDRGRGGGVEWALSGARNLLDRECARKNIRLSVENRTSRGSRVALPTHDVQQILVNLMLNAVQALEPGGGEIVVRAEPAGDRIRVSVEDSGPGIDPRNAEKVFDPFFTTKPAGSGLGLAIVRMLVQAGGGRIIVGRSDLGGAAFRVELPAAGAGEPGAANGVDLRQVDEDGGSMRGS